jgi:trimethylamine--corrinoid protein Co-methyltransferase
MTNLFSALAGTNVIYGLGMIESGIAFDIPSLVLDNEIAGMVLGLLDGVRVDDGTLAIELIKKVGAFETYLTESHTLEKVRDLTHPELMNRMAYDGWEAAGKPTAYGAAEAKAKEILDTHKVPPLEESKAKAIRRIIEEAEEETGSVDYWKGRKDKRFIGSGEIE